jgi:hypothetical protein
VVEERVECGFCHRVECGGFAAPRGGSVNGVSCGLSRCRRCRCRRCRRGRIRCS